MRRALRDIQFIQCDNTSCLTPAYKYDGSETDYERVRVILIKNDWWFDLAGCFCPRCHRRFNKGPNPLWPELLMPDLPGLTDDATKKIFKGMY